MTNVNLIVVLLLQSKGKSRKLVAPKSVGDYLDRIRTTLKTMQPDAGQSQVRELIEKPSTLLPRITTRTENVILGAYISFAVDAG